MATTTNYSWTTPDDTDLVKDGAAAIRTLGSAIDTSFAADQGDLLLGGTSDIFEPLAIGAAATVLTSDGTTASWAAPAGGGSNYTLLNAGGTALTGAATITVSGISNKDKIFVLIKNASSANVSSAIALRFNTDTGTNYVINVGQWVQNATYGLGNLGQVGDTQNAFYLSAMSNNAGSDVSGYLSLTGGDSSGLKMVQFAGSANASTGSGHQAYVGGGYYNSASSITSVSAFSTSGNFDAGTIFVYTSS
jgi:hypothetical protein